MTNASPTSPSVIVGISTYNRADVLPKAIRSAFEQSHKPLRVAVIDDASTDATPALQSNFPQVSWQRWDQNCGYVNARNTMMLNAPEDYYVSLDDDAWFLQEDEIAVAVDYLEKHPKVAAVAFDIVTPDEPQQSPRGRKSSVAMFIGCGHVLRLSVVKALAGYAKFPGRYGVEEKDLCLRLIDAGYEIVKFDGVHVWHDKTMTARDIPKNHRSGVCNDFTLTVWRFPGRILVQMLVWKFIAHLRFAAKFGLVRACLQGMRDFSCSFVAAWRNRRPVRYESIMLYTTLTRSPRERV